MTGIPSLVFPAEILDKCFENLLPPITVMDDSMWLEAISDLLQSRLVCRMFYRGASRWVWRRLEFNLLSNSWEIFINTSRISDICTFLVERPEVAAYVRVLSIRGPLSMDDSTDLELIPKYGRSLLAIAPLLKNLRLLYLNIEPVPSRGALGFLFSQPHLHTIWLSRFDGLGGSGLGLKINPSIRSLCASHCTHLEDIFPFMPSLEVFRYLGDEDIKFPPWNKLVEVGLESHYLPLVPRFVESFQVCLFLLHFRTTLSQILLDVEGRPDQCAMRAARAHYFSVGIGPQSR